MRIDNVLRNHGIGVGLSKGSLINNYDVEMKILQRKSGYSFLSPYCPVTSSGEYVWVSERNRTHLLDADLNEVLQISFANSRLSCSDNSNNLYIYSSDSYIAKYDILGEQKWRVNLGSEHGSLMSLWYLKTNELCFSSTTGIFLMGLDGANIRKINTHRFVSYSQGSDYLYGWNLIQGSSIYKLNLDGSEVLEILPLDGNYINDTRSLQIVGKNRVVVKSGSKLYSLSDDGEVISGNTVTSTTLIAGNNTGAFVTYSGSVEKITGNVKSTWSTRFVVNGLPIDAINISSNKEQNRVYALTTSQIVLIQDEGIMVK